jgi:flagellar hook assembly protein FlgD
MKIVNLDDLDWIVGYAVGDQGSITKYTELVTFTGIDGQNGVVPRIFSLKQNYPNPFNPSTTIAYTLPAQAEVSLKIVNLLGQEVCTLITGSQNAGTHEVVWDGSNTAGTPVASGVYFYKLEAKALDGKTYSDTRKMLLMK